MSIPPSLAGSRFFTYGIAGFILALVAVMLFALPSKGLAAQPQSIIINNARLDAIGGDIVFNCSVDISAEEELMVLLKDGAVIELSTEITLERKRTMWANATLDTRTYSCILRHDPLTRDFTATTPSGSKADTLRDRNLTRLLYNAWGDLSFTVSSVQTLREQDADSEFAVTATFKLKHTEVPPWLQGSLLFWSPEVAPAVSNTIEFTQ